MDRSGTIFGKKNMYRFDQIVGQEAVTEHLQNAIKTGSMSHAYIINGERGAGKKLLARTYAAALQCEDLRMEKGLPEPCGECRSCLQVMTANHPDIIVWPRKKPPKYSVRDDIRPFLPDVSVKPYQSPWKIYIFEDAEQLNVQSQNALLKTLEEPPAYAAFLLLSNGTDNFLPTVMSRCITLQMRQIPEHVTAAYLEREKGLGEGKARLCARFSRGNIGRALELSGSSDFSDFLKESVRLFSSLPDMDAWEIATAAGRFGAPERLEDFLELTSAWYRDVLVYKSTAGRGDLVFSDQKEDIKAAAGRFTYERMQKVTEAVSLSAVRIRGNVNAVMTLESMLLHIRDACLPGKA